MGSKWRKVKLALGLKLNTCLSLPSTLDDDHPLPRPSESVASELSQTVPSSATTPTPSSSGLVLSKSGRSSSERTCAICLTTMKPGDGHAIFTAECSHSFHFHCIASNVKHGNRICPVCRAKWKEIPLKGLTSGVAPDGKSRENLVGRAREEGLMAVLGGAAQPWVDYSGPISAVVHRPEPSQFDDDEALDCRSQNNEEISQVTLHSRGGSFGTIEVVTYPEVPSVARSASNDEFSVLIHLKALSTCEKEDSWEVNNESAASFQKSRAPVDLVTVLDVSGSMCGTKLALLKRAMGFVIQNLGSSDRLSVIAFSSAARRLFPLIRMTEIGRQKALQSVNSLVSNGGTNITEGLRKGAKIMTDRKWKNPVASIILLSDGQDTYNVSSPSGLSSSRQQKARKSLLPGTGLRLPVHTFGFGTDHDATAMHSISETSGGMFSFIEAEDVMQDAFAQCIGGLLSVVVQDLQVRLDCVSSNSRIAAIKSGSYTSTLMDDGKEGSINVGDLYAEEERDFLVTVKVPVDWSNHEVSLLKVKCFYRDPITKVSVHLEDVAEVKILRPENVGAQAISREVERQLNRLRAAEAIAEARTAAERNDLTTAISILESCGNLLASTASAQEGDRLCISLCAELKEMQERMANRRIYEASGRAYLLSGLSSHSWQRATARGDSTNTDSLVRNYQTPSMVDMVTQSQTMIFGTLTNQRKLRQTLSFPVSHRR
ncbi:hypothetical protein MLD38_009592 [Melastoma candidum]|uniref:Uncharacterized protein n=1 Tax=Melastoma candidum TaxID=119954 RepID=A0ACB9S2D3_9MYRT|nr:hypothetical protein MLD38_009592 [Melastoma candidum]